MNRKITYWTAQKIRDYKKRNPNVSYRDISRELDIKISDTSIWHILANRTYKNPRQKNGREKLTPIQKREIKGQLKLGRRMEWLAVKYNVCMSTIQRVKKNNDTKSYGYDSN